MKNVQKILIAVLAAIFGILTIIILLYLVIFGRALRQRGDHFAIALALPRAIMSSKAVRINDEAYLGKNHASFFEAMREKGFEDMENLGKSNILHKEGRTYFSGGGMYSSFFMVFSTPRLQEDSASVKKVQSPSPY